MVSNSALLAEFGGYICVEKPWVKFLLLCMGYVKQRGSTSAKLPVNEFQFLQMILLAIAEHNIPPQLVFNVDETGLHLVPVSNWMMEKKGARR